ncbi:unnamed protein product [Cuscuta campestris]|uniref:Uncharacterized protein n=1 Tax=Cuscuta campestris TaxID=132261 RepID=A0A484MNU2_9ASTE|nr:unnamed protein product [Cuscuta campestris]
MVGNMDGESRSNGMDVWSELVVPWTSSSCGLNLCHPVHLQFYSSRDLLHGTPYIQVEYEKPKCCKPTTFYRYF